MPPRIVIIGAGPMGIGAALRLEELGHGNYVVLEARNHPGGLSSSVMDSQGFTWDIGGHIQFSHYHHFDASMDQALGTDGWYSHERRSHIWLQDRFVPYPFQNNIGHLESQMRDRCLAGLEEVSENAKTANRSVHFRDWITSNFGSGIADVFLLPYNHKVWAYPLEKMDYRWVGERVSVVDVQRVRENIRRKREDVGWGPNATFRFPKQGGTGAIWEALAERIPPERFLFDKLVVSLDLDRHQITTVRGETYAYDTLISSAPINELCRATGEEYLLKLGSKMVATATHVVGVGLLGTCPEFLKDRCWMYFPEDNSPFYRVTVFSNYSPQNVPNAEKFWSLMTETSASRFKPVDEKKIISDTISGLLNTKLVADEFDIVSTWHFRTNYGYPVPFLGRDEILREIHAKLMPKNVFSRGRFGGWRYEVSNQDHSFMQGVEAVDHILSGKPETTYFDPGQVNQGKKI